MPKAPPARLAALPLSTDVKPWERSSAVQQVLTDLLDANRRDRRVIDEAEHRIKYRTGMIKIGRRFMRKRGLVNLGPMWGQDQYWIHKDSLPKR